MVICTGTDSPVGWYNAQHTPHHAATSAKRNGMRLYQRGLSKLIMKLNRYTASGSTQRNGITVTSWQILFVTANRSSEAQAGNSSQSRRTKAVESSLDLSTSAFWEIEG